MSHCIIFSFSCLFFACPSLQIFLNFHIRSNHLFQARIKQTRSLKKVKINEVVLLDLLPLYLGFPIPPTPSTFISLCKKKTKSLLIPLELLLLLCLRCERMPKIKELHQIMGEKELLPLPPQVLFRCLLALSRHCVAGCLVLAPQLHN